VAYIRVIQLIAPIAHPVAEARVGERTTKVIDPECHVTVQLSAWPHSAACPAVFSVGGGETSGASVSLRPVEDEKGYRRALQLSSCPLTKICERRSSLSWTLFTLTLSWTSFTIMEGVMFKTLLSGGVAVAAEAGIIDRRTRLSVAAACPTATR
jgi:hypothetical protein